MTTYDQQNQQVGNQTNIAGNIEGDAIQGTVGDNADNVIIGKENINISISGNANQIVVGQYEQWSARSGRCDFYQHITLPPNYVPRTELLTEVRKSLLADGDIHTVAFTSAIRMDALHGMGGIGKSVMARALCDDPLVQAAFPDGILWVTLGQTPNLNASLRDWIVNGLGDTLNENVTTENSLRNRLAQLLANRRCLLIVDDVWHVRDAEAFLVGGLNCRVLLTTRDAAIVEELGANLQSIPVMTKEEAVKLLNEWGGERLRQEEPELLIQIVQRLGRLPLAIKLAGGHLKQSGQTPELWLENFDIRKLQSRRSKGETHDSLEATFATSIKELSETDRELYTSLAIFKEDEAIPFVATAKLWAALHRLDPDGTYELLYDLGTRALLQLNPSQLPIEVNEQQPTFNFTVTLHDLLRDFISAELGKGGNLRAHQGLLSTYRQTRSNENWASAPDDGYLYDHLCYHLNQIADENQVAASELKSLFDNQTWLNARVLVANYIYDGYISDLMLTWQRTHKLVHNQIKGGQLSSAFVDCVRYALIRTSINSLAANYEPTLAARAINLGLWTPSRALSVASRYLFNLDLSFISELDKDGPVSERLRKRFEEHGEHLSEEDMVHCVQHRSEWEILHDKTYLIEHEDQALAVYASRIPQAEHRSKFVMAILETAPFQELSNQEVRRRAEKVGLMATLAIQDERSRASVLVELAPHLSGEAKEQSLQAALVVTLAIQDERSRASVLVDLVPQLSGNAKEWALQAALEAALTIREADSQARALIALAPQLSGDAKVRALQAALEAALTLRERMARARALVALAPQLSEQMLQAALEVALAIGDEELQAVTLVALAPQLSGAAKEQALQAALAAALAIDDEEAQAFTLVVLAPQLSCAAKERALQAALAAALAIDDEEAQAFTLRALAPQLSGDAKERALQAALAAVLAIDDEEAQAAALGALAPQLSGAAKEQALQAALSAALANTYDHAESRAHILNELAPQLSGDAKERALQAALAAALDTQHERARAHILNALAPHLSEQMLQAGLAAGHAIHDEEAQVVVLGALAPQLNGNAKERVLQAAMAAVFAIPISIPNDRSRARALVALAPQLSGQLLQEGVAAMFNIRELGARARTLAALAPQLSGQLLQKGVAVAFDFYSDEDQAVVLGALAPQLSGDAKEQALQAGLTAALAIDDEEAKARALVALVPQLSGDTKEQALQATLTAVLAIDDEAAQTRTLAALAPQLSSDAKERALQAGLTAALAIHDKAAQAVALVVLAPQLSGDVKEQALQAGLAAAFAIEDKAAQAVALVVLAPQLSGDVKEQALQAGLAAAFAIEDKASQACTLAEFLPFSPNKEGLQQQIRHVVVDALWEGSKHSLSIQPTLDPHLEELVFWSRDGFIHKDQPRGQLLRFCANSTLFSPPIFTIEILEDITESIIEISREWEWL